MKPLLIIAYFFPPAGSVGAYRPLKFAKYLPLYGWSPIVLTASNGKYPKYDEGLLDLIPDGTKVYRAPSFEWFNEGQNRANAGKPRRRTLFSRIHRRICVVWDYLMIPDNKVAWIPFVTLQGLRVIRRHNIGDVVVTGKPFSSFIAGWLLKKLCGVRLLIDYRDPWTQSINFLRRSPVHTWIEKWLERRIIKVSDVVIANTRVNEKLLAGEFGKEEERQKFITIHNGFDGEDYEKLAVDKFDKFTITYAGVFYFGEGSSYDKKSGDELMKTYSPFYFLEALQILFTRRPEIRDRFQVNLMGVLGHDYTPLIEDMGLGGVVHHLGYLDYAEHIAVLKRSHVLLLVLSRGEKSRGWIPSKFFSYLGSGNPILAMVPEGEVRDIMRRTRAGVFVDPDDADGAADALAALFDRYYDGRESFDREEEEVERYDRKHLTASLVRALEGLKRAG